MAEVFMLIGGCMVIPVLVPLRPDRRKIPFPHLRGNHHRKFPRNVRRLLAKSVQHSLELGQRRFVARGLVASQDFEILKLPADSRELRRMRHREQ